MRRIWLAFFSAMFLSTCASVPGVESNLSLDSILYSSDLEGMRWGILVTDLNGGTVFEQNADQRFLPASNTKLVTTAAAFQWIDVLNSAGPELVTHVVLQPSDINRGSLDLVLVGRGDPELESGPDCQTRCVEYLADQIVQSGVTRVSDIIADETWFPEENWPPGWSWEDLQTHYGTAVSALGINRNIAYLTVRPSNIAGQSIETSWEVNGVPYEVDVDATTTSSTEALGIRADRPLGSDTIRLFGEMVTEDPARTLRFGIDDPARYAAELLKNRLLERGVSVSGTIKISAKENELSANKNTESICIPRPTPAPIPRADIIAQLPAPDWKSALKTINKDSQNLYAEMVLRQLGKICGDGTTSSGLARVNELLEAAGTTPNGYDFFDGSGMSIYNRVSPRTLVKLLTYANDQNWGDDWRNTFPIGGVDGGLRQRFAGTPLEGKIFAKTGTLKGVNALSGYMISTSGKELAFSIIANDRPLSLSTAIPFMDQALIQIAENN